MQEGSSGQEDGFDGVRKLGGDPALWVPHVKKNPRAQDQQGDIFLADLGFRRAGRAKRGGGSRAAPTGNVGFFKGGEPKFFLSPQGKPLHGWQYTRLQIHVYREA